MGNIKEMIDAGKTARGIEFGSTRIKAVLVDPEGNPIASGSHGWENRLENQIWTYSLKDIREGLQDCYAGLKQDVKEKYGETLTQLAAMGFSGMMHGYMAFDKDNELLVPFRTWRNTMTEDAAKAALKELRLGVNVQTGTSDDVPEGQVYDQSPAAGTKVDVHTQVTINISSGKEKFSLDDVTGMQYQQAQAQLENDGLVVSLEFDYSDSVGSDKVISTSPKAGSQVAKGDTITITASKGKETKTTIVPNLLGQNIDDAIQMIKDAGLTYNGQSSDYSDSYSENQVMDQSISAGKTVDEGTTISLTVSLGSRVTSYSASIPIESPFGRDITDGDGNTDVYDSGQVTVVVYKPDGSSETVYDQNTSEGSLPGSVSTTSTASGSGTVYVYLNGVQVSSYSVDFE